MEIDRRRFYGLDVSAGPAQHRPGQRASPLCEVSLDKEADPDYRFFRRGPDIPAVGFAIGIDRTIVLMKKLCIKFKEPIERSSVFIVSMEDSYRKYCFKLLEFLRGSGYRSEINYADRSVGNHIKWAEKNAFSHVAIIGEDEFNSDSITLKDLKSFKQYSINWMKDSQRINKILKS